MTTDLLELKRNNYDEFIGTIPADVKRLAEMVFAYFKQNPGSYNLVLDDGAVYIYLIDDNFETTGRIVSFLDADFDHPPFKPYRNSDDDSALGVYDIYLKLNQEILDGSGFFSEPEEEEIDKDSPTKTRRMNGIRPRAGAMKPEAGAGEMMPGDAQPTEEVSREDMQQSIEDINESLANDSTDDSEPYNDGMGVDTYSDSSDDSLSAPAPVVTAEDSEQYMEHLKLIARDIENEALDIMKRTHISVGAIVPMTFVRIGQKLVIRTNQDQPSFDAHYEVIRGIAEEIFTDASEITATKNNVQIIS